MRELEGQALADVLKDVAGIRSGKTGGFFVSWSGLETKQSKQITVQMFIVYSSSSRKGVASDFAYKNE